MHQIQMQCIEEDFHSPHMRGVCDLVEASRERQPHHQHQQHPDWRLVAGVSSG